jgi:hypothetical protein
MRTWLNALRYYYAEWLDGIRYLNNLNKPHRPFRDRIIIPLINWKKYYRKRLGLLSRGASAYKLYLKRKESKQIIECPNCGEETYMRPYGTNLYRCYTCNDTPKEWQ